MVDLRGIQNVSDMRIRDVSGFTSGLTLVQLTSCRVVIHVFLSLFHANIGHSAKLCSKYDLLSGQRESVRFLCKKVTSWEEAPLLVNLLTSLAPCPFPLRAVRRSTFYSMGLGYNKGRC
ncbi:hypothetical protein E2C01_047830 [Portunus trituberculatus]|uniref:Uncharacterized protein n=1 Tax=Portunus trituberculatus TaxID=210409 RepID=A0A5B7G8S9_PORTR|nr:hypothetical protein [Portunus trituberculatus]